MNVKECDRCHGTGGVETQSEGERAQWEPCPDCRSRGFLDNSDELQMAEQQ